MLGRLRFNSTRTLLAAVARSVNQRSGCSYACQLARNRPQLKCCCNSFPIATRLRHTDKLISRSPHLISTRLYARTKRRATPVLEPVHETRVDVAVEEESISGFEQTAHDIAEQLEEDGRLALDIALQQELSHANKRVKRTELSVVLCDDTHIADLNMEWRRKAGPTDVLSFPMGDMPPGMPVRMLGDVIISLPTAQRQAHERGHDLKDEVRILLLHGLLHLMGLDHENGPEGAAAMEAAEQAIMQQLGWKGHGLIAAAEGSSQSMHDQNAAQASRPLKDMNGQQAERQPSPEAPSTPPVAEAKKKRAAPRPGDIKLICLDMDGTLLDSNSKVLPSSIEAIRAALSRGIRVCLATGKARPAAFEALKPVGLAGSGQLATYDGPGIFLQGLAVYGGRGQLLPGKTLPPAVVEAGFKYSLEAGVPLAAFLGDDCVTLKHAPELQELHERYYEPLAAVQPSLDAILQGPPVKKLLFMTDADVITRQVIPHWQKAAGELGAQATQAVPTMLELVPTGVDKWVGLQQLLQDLDLPREATMGVGDGGNDLTMVQHAGVGVAMGNAVPEVKAVAAAVVADNDSDGVAQAIEHFCLLG